ncbi:phage tail family protein [Anaerobacillus sp. MEB173]|uniref:phage tail family protein n=1 Tax=Anaerobacillus sp. MEB173 TaxID=3383345 RepID=UPI003F8F5719
MIHNFKVVKGDKVYDLWDMGVIVNSFIVESPSPVHNVETIEGRHGHVNMGMTYEGRRIHTRITMNAKDNESYLLLRNELFRLFDSLQSFYIQPDNEKSRQYLVKTDSTYSFERFANSGETSITFVSASPFAESISTTLDPLTFRNDHKINDMGLQLTEKDYIHTTNTFSIYSSSDTITDPREHSLIITFKGASNNLQIKNNTTGDTWQYNGTTMSEDIIVLDGIRMFKNGTSIVRDTNKKLITLASSSWNEFEISGTQGEFEISFDFKFFYF